VAGIPSTLYAWRALAAAFYEFEDMIINTMDGSDVVLVPAHPGDEYFELNRCPPGAEDLLEGLAREVEAEAGVGLKELEEVPVNAGEWAGVYEILEKAVGAERARYIVLKVEEILGASSPFKDPVFEVLDYTRQIYAVADLKELVVVRAKRWQDTIRYMEKVAIGAPTAIEVYVNPLGGISKFKVRWEAPTLTRPLEIGPAPLEDIVKRLAAEGLVIRERLVKDVAAAVVNGFVRSGRAVIKVEAEAPGFYLVNDRVEALRLDVPRPDPRELREALELLNELAGNWFGHARDKFSAVVKWGVMSPFSYIYKQKGKWMPWLYLHGSSHTGKTTLGDIVLSIWGLDSRYRKSGSNIDTPARIGYILSQGTFPVLVNEPGGAISKEDIIEIIKNAVEGLVVRGRYERGSYTEVPALAPLVITSNKVLPKDDALLRRFLVLRFTYGEKIDPAKAGEFEEKVKPRLSKLSALGRYITSVVLGEPGVLDRGWEEAAEALLEKAYREAGLEPPGWIYERPQAEDNIYEDMRESIRNFLVERINDAYFKAAGRVEVLKEEGISFGSRLELGFEERARVVLTAGLIPWMVLRRGEDGEELVMFFSGFARELEEVVGDIGGLKSIAELLGWGYKNVKLGGEVKRAAVVKLRDLIDFLAQ